jgi:inosine-uridine nucleoside N-ribohydrolase
LTNIALGFHMWQGKTSISSLRICGGANTGVGNVASNPGAEGNFMYDPEAAHIVFSVTLK